MSRFRKINTGLSKTSSTPKSYGLTSSATPSKPSHRVGSYGSTPSPARSASSHGRTPSSGGHGGGTPTSTSGGGHGSGNPTSPAPGGGGFGPTGIIAGGRPVFVRSLNIWSQFGLNIRDPTFAKALASHSKFDTSQDGKSLYDLNANRYKAVMLLLDQKSCSCALHAILMI